MSWGESLAAAAAAAAAVAAATAVPGPSGLQNNYLQTQQAVAAAIPTPIINPVRAKPPRKSNYALKLYKFITNLSLILVLYILLSN